MLIFAGGGKPENPEKNPRSEDENQQQTQPTYDAGSGNRTRATLVGGECPRSPNSCGRQICFCMLLIRGKHAKLLFINENDKERKTLCCSMMSKIKKGSASVLKYERK